MSKTTGIAWTDSTFNIAWGCVKVSPGCLNCYADAAAQRFGFDVFGPAKTTGRRTFGDKHWQEPLVWNRKAAKVGVRWRVFCSSMCDVFEDHPTIDAEREKLWPLIRATPMLDWQLLTKRPERIMRCLPRDWGDGYRNTWLGTSVENQRWTTRFEELIAVPSRVRFLSCEPLIGPVDLGTISTPKELHDELHLVIVGGESGPEARPMELEWARTLRDQCAEAKVPYFLKQLGGWPNSRAHEQAVLDGKTYTEMPWRLDG
jgi:protein gp37